VKLHFTYKALDDLDRLRAFIVKDNPRAARVISQALRRSIQHLVSHPDIGHSLDDPSGVREWIAGDYLVHYFKDDQAVTVLRTWHGKEQHENA